MSMEQRLEQAFENMEKTITETLMKLRALANQKVFITVKLPNAEEVKVQARRLKDWEIVELYRAIEGYAQDNQSINQLSSAVLLKVMEKFDELISRATGLPAEELKQLGDLRIRMALIAGLLEASIPSPEELEHIKFFRDHTRRTETGDDMRATK